MGLSIDFSGKVAVVAGASRGIGKAAALTLASCGADLVVAARKAEGLEGVAEEIAKHGKKCLVVPTNVRKADEIQNLIDRSVSELGRIDLLVNAAASVPSLAELKDLEEWAWDVVMNTNLKAYYLLSKAAAAIMIKQGGGAIVNVSGISGIDPEQHLGAYSISKAAVMHLTRAMGGELGRHNIRVNAIAPGLTRTEFARMLWENPSTRERYLSLCGLGRVAEPDEMAQPIAFLLSDAASYINGQTLVIDGGHTPWPHLPDEEYLPEGIA